MTNLSNYEIEGIIKEDKINYKQEILKYIYYWKFFLASFLFFFISTFFYIRYTPKEFKTTAKIEILDKKETTLDLPSVEDLFKNSTINLENEIEVLKSFPILYRVVEELNLHISVFTRGKLMESLVTEYPFDLKLKNKSEEIIKSKFLLQLTDNGFSIIDYSNEKTEYFFKGVTTEKKKHNLPFDIINFNREKYLINNESFRINFENKNEVVRVLKKTIETNPVGIESDIIELSHVSSNTNHSKEILNKLTEVFNNDGVNDKQLIHKRTIEFVNNRYAFLASELDSIEIEKEIYKKTNELVDFNINSSISLQQNLQSDEKIFSVENQISVTNLLTNTLEKSDDKLLPANMGIENSQINALISNYNNAILERNKLILSAGQNHPSVIQLNDVIKLSRVNIIQSLKNHSLQLLKIKSKFDNQSVKFDNDVFKFPEKEKVLRSIERNQQIKEALYLFLLQKREEAEVSYAVTEPSIKIVENAISDKFPFAPNKLYLFIGALLIGFLLPFTVLYIIFNLDTKINVKDDILKLIESNPYLGEIPYFDEDNSIFYNPSDRTSVSESFRMLMSNTNYMLTNKKCNVLTVTSSIKGEGKTLNAINLSFSYASIGKKVLLIGCDLRNPQIHKHLDEDKDQKGLVNFLIDNKTKVKDITLTPFKSYPNFDVILSGVTPPNPLALINNGNLEILIEKLKKKYDYILLDTAPTVLVADTKKLFNVSDAIIYIIRSGVSDKILLDHILNISKIEKANLGIVLNGIGQKNSYGYKYGYKYGYSYNYAYNYGYGYGYGNEEN